MMVRYGVLVLLLVGAAAVAQQPAASPSGWKAPEKASEKKNPFADKPQAAAGGEKVFRRDCALCHGSDQARRTSNAPDLATEAVQQQSDGALFWKITNGNTKTGMPGWSSLPEPQRWQLVLYIRSLKQGPK